MSSVHDNAKMAQEQQEELDRHYTELFAKAENSPSLVEGIRHLNAVEYNANDECHMYDVMRVALANLLVAYDEGHIFIPEADAEQMFKNIMAAMYMSITKESAVLKPHLIN